MKINATQMAELSYSDEYRNWAIECYGASLESAAYLMERLVGFTDFLEDAEYELSW